jgi:hypothetical protein
MPAWTPRQIENLHKFYYKLEMCDLVELLGHTARAITTQARLRGISKKRRPNVSKDVYHAIRAHKHRHWRPLAARFNLPLKYFRSIASRLRNETSAQRPQALPPGPRTRDL